MRKLFVLFFCGMFVLLLSCQNQAPVDITRPNIILIYADDMGYGDLGKYGANDYTTPNLDRMANQGSMFTHFYSVQAVCSASRAGLLTGCYPNRIGISGALGPSNTHGINADEVTIAEMLKVQGYATGIFGKWHLGHLQPFLPLQHGFDEYVGLPYSNDMWPVDYDGKSLDDTHHKARYPVLPLIEGNETIGHIADLKDQDGLTTLYTEKAVSFIERNKDHPFFLYMPHSMPHVPLGVSEKFKGKSKQGMYGDVIMEMDWSVGQVMETLEKHGLTENTLVIFTSDNGPWLNYGNHAGSTGGLREGKGTSYEGGQRVPSIMKWPAVIPAGVANSKLSATIDIFPTLAAITGSELPKHKIDGINILPLLRGEEGANPRDHLYYYYRRNSLEAVRKGPWKLVFEHPSRSYENLLPANEGWPGPTKQVSAPYGLYDLRRDPGERYDVQEANPEVVKELEALANVARMDLGDDLQDQQGENVRLAGYTGSPPVWRRLDNEHLAMAGTATYQEMYSAKFRVGEEKALIDGKLGSAGSLWNSWQGFEGNDVDVTIDLGKSQKVDSITVSFLQSQGSWVFLPTSVEYQLSADGQNFESVATFENVIDPANIEAVVKEHVASLEGVSTRYVRVIAKSVGVCPEDHPGAGEKAWVFVDEIVVR